MYRYGPWEKPGDMASNGGHALPDVENRYSWRDYTGLYKELISNGHEVTAYSGSFNSNMNLNIHYKKLGVKIGRVDYNQLLEQLGQYKWNIVGNNIKHKVWDYAMPNKFFDSLAAGSPVVNFGCKAVAKLIDRYGFGVNVDSVDEFENVYDDHLKYRANVFKNRDMFSMESGIHNLEALYGRLAKR